MLYIRAHLAEGVPHKLTTNCINILCICIHILSQVFVAAVYTHKWHVAQHAMLHCEHIEISESTPAWRGSQVACGFIDFYMLCCVVIRWAMCHIGVSDGPSAMYSQLLNITYLLNIPFLGVMYNVYSITLRDKIQQPTVTISNENKE